MRKRWNMRIRTIVTAAAVALIMQVASAQHGGLRVLSSNGVKAVVEDLQAQLERELGRPLAIEFGTTASLRQRIESGETFDVTILTTEAVDALAKSGKVAAASVRPLGRAGVGVGVRAGTTKPAIRTADEIKRSLLAAKSVTWVGVGASRPTIERMLETLGITSEVQAKLKLAPGSEAANEEVAAGHVDIVLTLASEILPAPGVDYVGPLPAELQGYVSFAAATAGSSSASADGARFIESLRARSAAKTYEANGMELANAGP
jgi:molybdate transport system substrate-binding protein